MQQKQHKIELFAQFANVFGGTTVLRLRICWRTNESDSDVGCRNEKQQWRC